MSLEARIIYEIDNSPLRRDKSGYEWLCEPGNVALLEDDDLALFDYLGNNQYAVHLFFESRGRDAIERLRDFMRQMFTEYGAHMLFGYIPVERRDVAYVAAQAGAIYAGKRNTPFGPVRVYMYAPETH